jgi:hypothetical protein
MMEENAYLNNKAVSVAIFMLSLISIGLGLVDFNRFPIPAIWSIIEGVFGIVLVWFIWGYRRGGVPACIAFLVVDLVGWILISSFLVNHIAVTAEVNMSELDLVTEAINRRLQFRIPIAVFIAFWSWLRKERFIN